MKKGLLALACTLVVVLSGIACGKNPVTPTPYNSELVDLQPKAIHLNVGQTASFSVGIPRYSYKLTPSTSAFNVSSSGSQISVTYVSKVSVGEVVLDVAYSCVAEGSALCHTSASIFLD